MNGTSEYSDEEVTENSEPEKASTTRLGRKRAWDKDEATWRAGEGCEVDGEVETGKAGGDEGPAVDGDDEEPYMDEEEEDSMLLGE